jgi:hypothetical protein
MSFRFLYYVLFLLGLMTVRSHAVFFNPPVVTLADAPHPSLNAHAADINSNFAGIIADGAAAVININAQIAGLGTAGVPIGAFMWWNQSATCPSGYFAANGNNGTLNTVGYYIRGLDSGRGLDPGRTLGSLQADSFADHNHTFQSFVNFWGYSNAVSAGASYSIQQNGTLSGNTSNNSADTETRPLTLVMQNCQKVAFSAEGVSSSFFSSVPVNLSASPRVPHAADLMADFNSIIANGNTVFNALQTALNAATAGSVPVGAVAFFNQATCPTGWSIADGSGGKADMRGVFVTSGPSIQAYTGDSIVNHAHLMGSFNGIMGANVTSLNFNAGGSVPYASSQATVNLTSTALTGNRGTETRPKNIALLPCEKL